MILVRLLHDYTVVVNPSLTPEDIAMIEAACDGGHITPAERQKRLHLCGMRGDIYPVETDEDARQLALAGNAVPANDDDLKRLLSESQIKSLNRREMRQRAIQTGTATGDLNFDMRSPATLDAARKKRCQGMLSLRSFNEAAAKAAADAEAAAKAAQKGSEELGDAAGVARQKRVAEQKATP